MTTQGKIPLKIAYLLVPPGHFLLKPLFAPTQLRLVFFPRLMVFTAMDVGKENYFSVCSMTLLIHCSKNNFL